MNSHRTSPVIVFTRQVEVQDCSFTLQWVSGGAFSTASRTCSGGVNVHALYETCPVIGCALSYISERQHVLVPTSSATLGWVYLEKKPPHAFRLP